MTNLEMQKDPRMNILEGDIATLFKLIFTHNKPLAEGDIRAASNILRRWICEGMIGQFCNDCKVQPTFPILDNSEIWLALPSAPSVNYFLTGGVRFNGAPVMGIYNSTVDTEGAPVLPIKQFDQILVGFGHFKKQKRIYFEGESFTCEEIILFTANKLGGVHLDSNRNSRQAKMERAALFMTFGGPLSQIEQKPSTELHLELEPNSKEILSGFHLEIIAAGASFLGIHIDGEPFVEFETKKSIRNRVADYIPLVRKRPVMKLHDFKQ